MIRTCLILWMFWLFWLPLASAAPIKQQKIDGGSQMIMSSAELAELGDPFFSLVLGPKPDETRFDEVVKLIKGESGVEKFFVVGERIADSKPGPLRRAVVGFNGSNQQKILTPNVMLSILFNDKGITPGFIEAWGWDDKRSRYNYYRLDNEGGTLSWKFRGSSIDADKKPETERQGTCMACHRNGGPVMKELAFPWNNWHSSKFEATYLTPSGNPGWPIASNNHLAQLKEAQDLEMSFILPALKQFNGRRIDALMSKSAAGEVLVKGGKQTIVDGQRALRSLFQTTEYNAISSDTFSGLHPFQASDSGLPSGDVKVPDSFFLNANLLAGGGANQYQGIGVGEARNFKDLLLITPKEYKELVSSAATKINKQVGDNHFAWFVPEASHVDNSMADILIKKGVITPQFAAAVVAVDLENPVFSKRTPSLLRFIPSSFRFVPRNGNAPASHPDELTKAVITALQKCPPTPGSVEADFLQMLKSPNPVAQLRQRVQAYLAREQAALDIADPTRRAAELKRLFQIVIDRRRTAITQTEFRALDETANQGGLLFAVP